MEAEPPWRIVILRSDLGQYRYLDNLERLHDRHWQIGDELDESSSVAGKPVLETGVGIVIDIVQRRAFGLVVIVDPMGVAEATRVLMLRIAVVCVLERRLGECEHETRDDAEMKNLPHEVPFYTRRTARVSLVHTFDLSEQRYRFA